MFSRIKSFLYRHKKKIIVAGVVIVGADLLLRFSKKWIADYVEKQQKEIMSRSMKLKHFQNVESTCDRTAENMMLNLLDTINKLQNSDVLLEKLKDPDSNKIEIWEKLKLIAFSKLVLIVYATSFLMVTLRIELNVMGGYIFKSVAGDSNDNFSSDLREKYLLINEYFLTHGIQKLSALVSEKVQLVLSTHSLTEKLTHRAVEQIFYAIHTAVTSDTNSPFTQFPAYILPAEEPAQDPTYQKIIMETKDLLETDEVTALGTTCVIRGLTYFLDIIGESFIDRAVLSSIMPVAGKSKAPDAFFAANLPKIEEAVSQKEIPLAKIIPVINNLLNNGSGNVIGIWTKQLIAMDNLKTLGANIYECFSE